MGGFVSLTLEFCVVMMCVLLSFSKIGCATLSFGRQSSLSVPSSSSLDHGSNQSTGAEERSGRKLFSIQTQTALFPSVWEAVLDAGINPHRYNLSADCSDSLRDYSQGYSRQEPWAVRMFDSSGKPAPGMMMGGLTQFGNYDECLNLRHYPELAQNRTAHVRRTQYCSVFFTIPDWMVQFFSSLEVPYPVKLTRVTVDLCVPRTCTESDIHSLVSQYVSSGNNNITAEEGVNCFQPEQFSSDGAAIVVVFLLSLILLLVFLGTCVDLVQRMSQIQAVSGPVSEVGLLRRHTSRLSRFGSSFYHHWKRIGSGKGREEISPQRRNTIGYKPSIIRRISNSVVGKYAIPNNDPDNPPDPSTIDKIPGQKELTRASSRKGGTRNSQASGADTEVTHSLSKKGGGQKSHAVPCGDQGMAQLTMVKRLLSEDGEPRGSVGAEEKRAQNSANNTQRQSNGVVQSDAQRDTTNRQRELDNIGDATVQTPLIADRSVAFNVQTGEVYMTANTNSSQHGDVSPRSEPDRSTNTPHGQTSHELRDCEEYRAEDCDTTSQTSRADNGQHSSVNTPSDCDKPEENANIPISKADSRIQEKLTKDREQTEKETDEEKSSIEKKATKEKLSSSATTKVEGCGLELTTTNTATENATAGRSETDKKLKDERSAEESSALESSCASIGAVDGKGKSSATDEQAAESTGGREPETAGKQTLETIGKQTPETTGKQTPENTGKQTLQTTGKQTPENTGKQTLQTTGKQTLQTTGKQTPETIGQQTLETTCIEATQAAGSEQTSQSVPQRQPDTADQQTTETTRKETLENSEKQGPEGTGKPTPETSGRQVSGINESRLSQDPTGKHRPESAHKNRPDTTDSKQAQESSGTQTTGKPSGQASDTSRETTRTQTAHNTETVTANGTAPVSTEQVTLRVETDHQNTVTQSPHESRHSHPSTPHHEDSLISPGNERCTSPKLLRFHDEQGTPSTPTLTASPNLPPSTKSSTRSNTTQHTKPQICSPKRTRTEADDNTPQSKTPHHTPSKGGLLSIPEEVGGEKKNFALHYRKLGCKSLPVNNNDDDYKDEEDDGGVRWRYRHESEGSELEMATKDVEGGKTKQEDEDRHSLVAEVLLSFSFLRSVRKVMGEGNADHLFSLNGVRVLSICWIVLGNTMAMLNNHPALVANKVDISKMAQTMWFQAVMNGTFAADTFFILSGCLVCYHFLRAKSKQLQEKPGTRVLTVKAVLLFYLHRFMRILPCYYVVLLSYTTLLPYLGDGPYWSSTDHALRPCRDHWWANALFFSNFYQPRDMCMSWSYYLVNDIQMYLLSPLVLYPLLFLPQVGLLLLVLLVAIQIITTVFLTEDCNGNLLSLSADFFATVYAKPYCRVGAFAIGMGLGYFLHSTRRQIFFRKMPLILGWLTSLGVVGTVVYVTQQGTGEGAEEGWTVMQCALYQAFSRPAWCLAVSFIIFVCSIGQGGFVYRLLSWNAFLPLCRITYGVYLLHPVLITAVLNGARYPFYSTFGTLIYQFVSNLVCAYGLAFFLITLVETPFTSLEALLRARCT